jgi:hypothetical protein
MIKFLNLLLIIGYLSADKIYAQVNEQGVDTVGRSNLDTPSISKQQKSIAEQQLIKIKLEELPQSVINNLQRNSYKDWTIQDAYRNIVLKQYSVKLKKGNEMVFYTFDANGKRIE